MRERDPSYSIASTFCWCEDTLGQKTTNVVAIGAWNIRERDLQGTSVKHPPDRIPEQRFPREALLVRPDDSMGPIQMEELQLRCDIP